MAFRQRFAVKLKPCLDCPVLVETRCRRTRCEPCQHALWRRQFHRAKQLPCGESPDVIEATYRRALAQIRHRRLAESIRAVG